ncbi:unnamed protein product [Choristocarpus tenellus]
MVTVELGTPGQGRDQMKENGLSMEHTEIVLASLRTGLPSIERDSDTESSECLDLKLPQCHKRGGSAETTGTLSVSGRCTPESDTAYNGLILDRVVKFADELGEPLVKDVFIIEDWWEEMVFGEQGLPFRSRGLERDGTNEEGEDVEGRCLECQSLGGCARSNYLLEFLGELTCGIEATLKIPGLLGKRKQSIVLYTDDNGATICWIERGGKQRAPYKLPCCCLLKVTDRRTESKKRRGGRVDLKEEAKVGLTWRVQPTFSKRSATIKVQSCKDVNAFTRGMLQLSMQNVNI